MQIIPSIPIVSVLCIALLGAMADQIQAATFTVTNLNDSGAHSLRQALADANRTANSDTITFAPGVAGTLTLTTGQLAITSDVTLAGPTNQAITISGADKSRLFYISGTQTQVLLSHLTLAHGFVTGTKGADGSPGYWKGYTEVPAGSGGAGGEGQGGAIFNEGILRIEGVTFTANMAWGGNGGAGGNSARAGLEGSPRRGGGAGGAGGNGLGGAIYNIGILRLTNTTFYLNRAGTGSGGARGGSTTPYLPAPSSSSGSSLGGAIYDRGTLTLDSCTLSSNSAIQGGALFLVTSAHMNNSLLVGDGAKDVNGIISGQHNLISGTAQEVALETDESGTPKLKNNGGPTQTIALLAGSPAINRGKTTLSTDQRGIARPQGKSPDIGAFEYQFLPTISINSPSVKEGDSGTIAFTFTLTLSQASTKEVSVLVNTLQGTAKAGSDYQSIGKGTVTFGPGTTKQTFTVQVVGDTLVEGNEQFQLALRSPINATIGSASGTGTIVNDDSTPKTPNFADSGSHA